MKAMCRLCQRAAGSWALLLVVLLAAGSAACSHRDPPHPIVVVDNVVTVQNSTSEQWHRVEVWLNYHYRVTRASMPSGERFGIPLNVFVAGFGQRFDVRRQVVRTVQVKATTSSGARVDLMFGTGPRR
jgi:hypothetical protein